MTIKQQGGIFGRNPSFNTLDATTVTASGNITSSAGNIVIGTSGKGIDFSATSGTGTSELFSDYEEGSWSPTFLTSATDFDSITYDVLTGGFYTKIGNMVHIQATIRTDAVTVGSASGSLYIGGLPYTSVADTGSKQDSRAPLSVTNVINFATNQPSGARIAPSSTNIVLYYRTSSNGFDITVPYTDLNTGANQNLLRVAGSYIAS